VIGAPPDSAHLWRRSMGGAIGYRVVTDADLPRVARLLHHAFAG